MSKIYLSEQQSITLYRHNYLRAIDFTGHSLILLDLHAFGTAKNSNDITKQVTELLAYVQSLLAVHNELELYELNKEASMGLTTILNLCRTLLSVPGNLAGH